MASCEAIVPKGGSLLPDIRVRDLGKYIESMKAQIDAFEEEFKVRHHCSLKLLLTVSIFTIIDVMINKQWARHFSKSKQCYFYLPKFFLQFLPMCIIWL